MVSQYGSHLVSGKRVLYTGGACPLTGSVPGDPRWIGCWWIGYLIVAVGILATSVPLWYFPATMTGHRPQRAQSSWNEHDAAGTADDSGHRRDSVLIVASTWKQIKGSEIRRSDGRASVA